MGRSVRRLGFRWSTIAASVLGCVLSAAPAKANLIATWDARDFRAGTNGNTTTADGANVSGWSSSSSTSVMSSGATTPVYENAFTPAGTDAVTFLPSNSDAMAYSSGTIPFGGKSQFTIAVVFKPNAAGVGSGPQWYYGTGVVDAEQGGAVADWGLTLDSNGHLMFGIGAADTTITTSGASLVGDWHVVVATWDGTVSNTANMHLYVDGVLASSVDGPDGTARNSAAFGFARQPSGQGGYLNAAFAEVRMYDHALTPVEASTLYSQLQATHLNAASIPTLSEWGMIIMASLLGLTMMWTMRRRSSAQEA